MILTLSFAGQVLSWIRSFLTERSQRVAYAGSLSSLIVLLWGVPQGSVFGPLLFLIYTAELFDIIVSHGASAHFYADDGQLYVNSLAADRDDAINCLQACVAAVEQWMKSNRLRLNQQKTQLIWLGSQQQLDKVTTTDIQLLNASIHPLSAVRDLGVTIDCRLTMADHVTAVCRTSCEVLFSCWRQRRRILWFTPSSAAASTTAMPCCTALHMADCSDCNQSRTQLRVWWLEPGASTTLRQFSSHFIGCRCDNASLSSWRHWFTSAWTAEHLATWPTTSVLPAAIVLAHGQPPAWCWTSLARRRHWETEHLPSPDRVSGTAFLLPSVLRHSRRQSSESCWYHRVAQPQWHYSSRLVCTYFSNVSHRNYAKFRYNAKYIFII